MNSFIKYNHGVIFIAKQNIPEDHQEIQPVILHFLSRVLFLYSFCLNQGPNKVGT